MQSARGDAATQNLHYIEKSINGCPFDTHSESTVHSAKKGHVPNQSLYKGWEQSFSPFFPDQKMDIIFCQDGQFIKCRNKICFLLLTF